MRRTPAADEPLSRVRLRAGSHLTVIDLSNAGALLEGTARLLPGTPADVHIVTTEGRLLVRSRIVRAYVSQVEADRMEYRGAIAFDRLVQTTQVGYAIPEVLAPVAAAQGNAYPDPDPIAADVPSGRRSA